MTDPVALVARLITREPGRFPDPLTFNVNEGMDDGCWWCDAPERTDRGPRTNPRHYARHAHDCPWVEAMRLLGLDLGEHEVAEVGEEIPRW